MLIHCYVVITRQHDNRSVIRHREDFYHRLAAKKGIIIELRIQKITAVQRTVRKRNKAQIQSREIHFIKIISSAELHCLNQIEGRNGRLIAILILYEPWKVQDCCYLRWFSSTFAEYFPQKGKHFV